MLKLCFAALAILIATPASGNSDFRRLGQEMQEQLNQARDSGRLQPRCALGVTLGGPEKDVVIAVAPNQPALRAGDRITRLQGERRKDISEFLATVPPDGVAKLAVLRDGTELEQDIACRNFANEYQHTEVMVRAVSRNRPGECLTAIDAIRNERGMDSYLHNVYQQCLFAENRRNQQWINTEYPKVIFFVTITNLREWAAIAQHTDTGLADYESVGPLVIAWAQDLKNRNATTFADELQREYDRQLAALRQTNRGPSAPRPEGKGDTALGTCFVIRPDGLVATNAHVVQGAGDILITLTDGRRLEARLEAASSSVDLALLRISAHDLPYLSMSAARTAQVGMDVFTMGFPSTHVLGSEVKYSAGVINALSGIGGEQSVMQISVPLHPGNSGGPLVNDKGEVVGVVTSTASAGAFLEATGTLPQNVNWAVKSDLLATMFDEPIRLKPTSSREEAIKRTGSALCAVEAMR